MTTITRDYETRSCIDLGSCGNYKYAMHPSTDVMCLALQRDDNDPVLWVPEKFIHLLPQGHGLPLLTMQQMLDAHTRYPEAVFSAHNDSMERVIDEYVMKPRYGLAPPPLEKRQCTLAQAAISALPRSLGDLSTELDLAEKKDEIGYKVMLRMCKPETLYPKDWLDLKARFGKYQPWLAARAAYKAAGSNKGKAYSSAIAFFWEQIIADGFDPNDMLKWNEDPQDFLDLCRYCLQDVRTERKVELALPPMPKSERRVWLLDQVINRRGVHIDAAGARAALKCFNEYKAAKEQELRRLTGGAVESVGQAQKLKDWCADHDVVLPNTQADTIEYYIKQGLPDNVAAVLQIKSDCGQTSPSKYDAMLRAMCPDHRVRGVFLYAAAGTGRWSATLVQLHNMPRGTIKLDDDEKLEAVYQAMHAGWQELEILYGDVVGAIASAIRGAVTAAPGNTLRSSDFKSVEAICLPWMAGEEDVLDVFRAGLDSYKIAALKVFGGDYDTVPAEQRQCGKVSELSFGYGGTIGAYNSMAKNYGIDLETLPPLVMPTVQPAEYAEAFKAATRYLTELEAAITRKEKFGIGDASPLDRISIEAAMSCSVLNKRWRAARPGAVDFWNDADCAVRSALMCPGEVFTAGMVKVKADHNFLRCRMPSGRVLLYCKPMIVQKKKFDRMASVITYMRFNEGQWRRVDTYGPKLVENWVQATCADLLRHGMLNAEAAGYPIVLHVHDQPVAETRIGWGSQEEFDSLVSVLPPWAEGMPFSASGWSGHRFRKD